MRLPKGSGRNFQDRTRGTREDILGALLATQPSSISGLTDRELDMRDAGWSVNDLYFLRAAQADGELPPNKTATYFDGYDSKLQQEYLKQMQFEKIMKDAYTKRKMKR